MSHKAAIFFGSILFVFCLEAGAQQADSYPNVSWYQSFFDAGVKHNPDSAFKIVDEKLSEAIAIRDYQAEVRLRNEAALLRIVHLHDYAVAMDHLMRALAIEDSLNILEPQVVTYLAISQLFEKAGDLDNSAQSLEQALVINEQAPDVEALVFILNKLGKINLLRGNTEGALENFSMVLHYKDDLKTSGAEAEALCNLAMLYTRQEKFDEALATHKRSLAIRRRMKDQKNEAQSLHDIGELYKLMKNDTRALANHVVALEIRQRLNDKAGLAESYNNIGVLYYDQKNFQKALPNLLLALEAGRDAQVQEEIRKSYDYLSLCSKETGDYKKALEYRDLYVAISEFIQNERNEQRIAETQNRYMLEKKESQIQQLESIRIKREREIHEQKQFRNFLMALMGLGGVIILLVLYLNIIKQRSNRRLKAANTKVQQQNTELQELNATKDKFFSIISHDLKGPLNSLTSFSSLLINHTDSLSKDEIKMLANDLDKSLKNLFALLENLLEWSRSQTGNIEFTPEQFSVNELLEQNKTLLTTQAQNKEIAIRNASNLVIHVNAHRNSVNTVIRNLISNAIKFTPRGGTITLNVSQRNGEAIISVADTGVGMRPEVIAKLFRIDAKHTTKGTAEEKGTGLGLILCREFVEKNKGRIWVESTPGKGSEFCFSLPFVTSSVAASKVEAAPALS